MQHLPAMRRQSRKRELIVTESFTKSRRQPQGRPSMRFAGYAALFDRVDRGGDVVRRGAFARAVGRSVPLLSEHRPALCIGWARIVGEDRRGLRVIAQADAGVPVAARMGLSFGYRVRTSRGERPRQLLELDLVEVSLVRVPMQPGARVHMVED